MSLSGHNSHHHHHYHSPANHSLHSTLLPELHCPCFCTYPILDPRLYFLLLITSYSPHLKPIISPRTEFHNTSLLVKRKIFWMERIEKSDVSMSLATLSRGDEKKTSVPKNDFCSYQHLFRMNFYKWLAGASRLSPCS
jgi:hypothetical protein